MVYNVCHYVNCLETLLGIQRGVLIKLTTNLISLLFIYASTNGMNLLSPVLKVPFIPFKTILNSCRVIEILSFCSFASHSYP